MLRKMKIRLLEVAFYISVIITAIIFGLSMSILVFKYGLAIGDNVNIIFGGLLSISIIVLETITIDVIFNKLYELFD